MKKIRFENSKISVIMSSYNSEKFIRESILSILNQSHKDFELIIIDDCSKDRSLIIARQYREGDNRIKIIENKKNIGAGESRNRGLKIARGKYIAILDSDDIADEKRLENQLRYLEKEKDVFLVGSSAIVINEKGRRIGIFKKTNNKQQTTKKLSKSNTMIHPSIMFRNNGETFYRKKFKTSEDYDLYLRLISSGKKIANLSDPLIKYRINLNSLSYTNPNQKIYFEKAKEFYFERLKNGEDGYDSFKITKKKVLLKKDIKKLLNLKIFIQLLDGQGGKTRRDIRAYIKEYGRDNRLLIYYILSLFPKKVIWNIKKLS